MGVSGSTGALGGLRGLIRLQALLQHMRVIVLPRQKTIPKASDAYAPDGSSSDSASQRAVERIGAKLTQITAKRHS